jgi:hypothetical protein
MWVKQFFYHLSVSIPDPLIRIYSALLSWRICNSYGVFPCDPGEERNAGYRAHIVIEAKEKEGWTPIHFRYLTTNPKVAGKFLAPFHARLDSSMFYQGFDAQYAQFTGSNVYYSGSQTITERLIARLLEGSVEVAKLMEMPPKFPLGDDRVEIRAMRYAYRFSTMEEYQKTQDFWQRHEMGEFLAPKSKKDVAGIPFVLQSAPHYHI